MPSRRFLQLVTCTIGCVIVSALLPGQVINVDEHGRVSVRGLAPGAADLDAELVVQEWGHRSIEAKGTAPTGVNTVGSIVAIESSGGGLLPMLESTAARDWQTEASRDQDAVSATQTLKGDWRIESSWQRLEGAVRASGRLVNLRHDDRPERPVTLSLVLKMPDADEFFWLGDLRRKQSLRGAPNLIETVPTTAGALGTMSKYPFGALGNGTVGIGLGFPLDQPRIQRIHWDAKREALVAEIDVAVSSMPSRFPNEIPFSFLLFAFDGAHDFRGAAQAYYGWNADSYALRLPRQGQWMPFTQIDTVERVEDFAFQFHEYHPNVSVAYNRANGIESLVYSEPPVQYVNLSANQPRDVDFLTDLIDGLDTVQGSQVRSSGTRDRDGNLPVAWVETPWAVGGRVPTNGTPDVPRSERDTHNSFDANWLPYIDLYRREGDDAPAGWQGGRRIDGALGMRGKALLLAAGESAAQSIRIDPSDTAPLLTLRAASATASAGSMLTIRLENKGEAAVEFPVMAAGGLEPAVLDVPLAKTPLMPGDYTLSIIADGSDVVVDDVALMGGIIENPDFEAGANDAEAVTGMYLDSFEGWDSPQLNFRRDHLEATRLPLTFDAQTGETAQVVMMHNFELADEMRGRLHDRGHLLMANTALYQWSWSAHYLDVLGIETSWGETETISPPRLDELDFLRTMLYHKPYCYLNNVEYANFRGKKVEDYFALCFQYGLWPGFFSHNAAESPYWQDPKLYNADRRYFLHFMRPQQRVTAAGWEPVTHAAASDARLLVERWGGGAELTASTFDHPVYFTCYNPSTNPIAFEVELDADLAVNEGVVAYDLLNGSRLLVEEGRRVRGLHLPPRGVAAIAVIPRRPAPLKEALSLQQEDVCFLIEKYRRFGFLEDTQASEITVLCAAGSLDERARWFANVHAAIGEEYRDEWRRSMHLLDILAASSDDVASGRSLEVSYPPTLVRGTTARFALANGDGRAATWTLRVESAGRVVEEPMGNDGAEVSIPAEWSTPTAMVSIVGSVDGASRTAFEGVFPIEDQCEWVDLPDELLVRDRERMVVGLKNNTDQPLDAAVSATSPPGLQVTCPPRVQVPPRHSQSIELTLETQGGQRAADANGVVSLSIADSSGLASELRLPITVLATNASKLRGPGRVTTVDSFYFGYDLKAITDGRIDPAGLGWAEAAWASGEGMVPHWVEFNLDAPQRLGEVVIYWAPDSDTYMTSQQVLLQVADAGGDWVTVATHESAEVTPMTTLSFEPVETRRLRLFQPTGKGPAPRPGILWLMEVEAR